MIKDNKILMTNWDAIYMAYNELIGEEIFEKACADEWPLIGLLDEMKDNDCYPNIVEWFYEHYNCFWYDTKEGQCEEVEEESTVWWEGYNEYKTRLITLANYFKTLHINNILKEKGN